jgi:hypothetical protein
VKVPFSTGTPCFSHSTANIIHLQRCASQPCLNFLLACST